jgi:hypothetical protein
MNYLKEEDSDILDEFIFKVFSTLSQFYNPVEKAHQRKKFYQ